MVQSDSSHADPEHRPRRRSLVLWLAKRVVVSFIVMSILSMMGIGYVVHRNRGIVEDALQGLDVVAERLEQNDKDSAAEALRDLQGKLEGLKETSGDCSERVRRVLGRIREHSEDLYLEATRALGGDEPDEAAAATEDASPP